MSIYGDMKELEAMIDTCFNPETGEINPQDDGAYQKLMAEITVGGLERLAKVRANKMAFINGAELEIDRLTTAKKREQKQLDWIENYMLAIYDQSQKDKKGKVIAGTFTIGTRKSTRVDVDDNFDNKDYQTIVETKKIEKAALKKDLLAGVSIDGARLSENRNLTIN